VTAPLRRELPDGGYVEYETGFLSPGEGVEMQRELVRDLTWETREIVLFGKHILQPRLIAWAGNVPYRYSGQTLDPRPPPRALRDILERVVQRTGVAFNHVLANRYRDGKDSMGFHADDESELGPSPTVASVSLGATRRFVLIARRGKQERTEYRLEHGSLLVMGAPCQQNYRHGIPKEPAVGVERVSLTFRKLAPLAASADVPRTRQ
jgi:alkylated DNA repair dioxygenase AlkB